MLSDGEYEHGDGDHGGSAGVFSHRPEEWMDYNSEFLLTLWHQLQDQVASMGVYILDSCTIGDFTEFCFRHSSGRKPPC